MCVLNAPMSRGVQAKNPAFPTTLGPLDPEHDPRGGPRPVRRVDDRRLRSARQLRGKSGDMGRAKRSEATVGAGPDSSSYNPHRGR
jgi:hypothetical protein